MGPTPAGLPAEFDMAKAMSEHIKIPQTDVYTSRVVHETNNFQSNIIAPTFQIAATASSLQENSLVNSVRPPSKKSENNPSNKSVDGVVMKGENYFKILFVSILTISYVFLIILS